MPIETKQYHGPANEVQMDDTGIMTTSGVGSVPAAVASYVEAVEYGDGQHHRTVLKLSALSISTVDNGTDGHAGSVKLYDFPQGYVHIKGGAQAYTAITVDGTGLPDDVVLDIAVGSTAAGTDMETLSGTAEDILTKDDITLSSSVTATNQFQQETTGGGIDGTSTAVDAYLNIAATAATADDDGTIVLTGELVIDWVNYGYAG